MEPESNLRQCSQCGEYSDIKTGFYMKTRKGLAIPFSTQTKSECKICRRARSARNYRERQELNKKKSLLRNKPSA